MLEGALKRAVECKVTSNVPDNVGGEISYKTSETDSLVEQINLIDKKLSENTRTLRKLLSIEADAQSKLQKINRDLEKKLATLKNDLREQELNDARNEFEKCCHSLDFKTIFSWRQKSTGWPELAIFSIGSPTFLIRSKAEKKNEPVSKDRIIFLKIGSKIRNLNSKYGRKDSIGSFPEKNVFARLSLSRDPEISRATKKTRSTTSVTNSMSTKIPEPIRKCFKDVVKKTSDMAKKGSSNNTTCTVTLGCKFGGKIPDDVREKISKAVTLYGKENVFIISEPKTWEVKKEIRTVPQPVRILRPLPVGDPLLVVWKADTAKKNDGQLLFVCDFDTTDVEEAAIFARQPDLESLNSER